MSQTRTSTPRATAVATLLAGAALGASGIIQLTDEQSAQSTVVGIEHVTLGLLSALLLLLIPAVLHLGAVAGQPRAALVSATGQTLLAALCVVSNVRGEDPSFFAAVAVPTNLMWLGGSIAIGIALRRRARVPLVIAAGLPLTWIMTMPMAMIGGGLLACAYWVAIGWMLLHDELPGRSAEASGRVESAARATRPAAGSATSSS